MLILAIAKLFALFGIGCIAGAVLRAIVLQEPGRPLDGAHHFADPTNGERWLSFGEGERP